MSRRHRGLTLIELVITMAVLGVLAAVAFPNMSDFIDRQRLVSQTLAVAELAQTARSEAIKRSAAGPSDQKMIAMSVNPGSSWSVGLANGNSACSGAECVINQGGTDVPYLVNADHCSGCTMVAPAAGSPPVVMTFDFRGLVRGGTNQEVITIRSPKGKQLSVRVSRLGRISMCSPAGSVTGYPTC